MPARRLFLFKIFVSVPSLFSRVRCFAGGSACWEQGSPLSPGSRVLHFAELFENRFFFACRSLRIRGTGRDLWQDSHEKTFDSAQYSVFDDEKLEKRMFFSADFLRNFMESRWRYKKFQIIVGYQCILYKFPLILRPLELDHPVSETRTEVP